MMFTIKGSLATGGVKILKILWHLFNLGVVVILNLSDELCIVRQHKVDCYTFSTETSGSTNSVNVVLLLHWKFIVDDEANLLDIDTSCQKIRGDEHSCGSGSEFSHDCVSLNLVHFSMHSRNSEVILIHGFL